MFALRSLPAFASFVACSASLAVAAQTPSGTDDPSMDLPPPEAPAPPSAPAVAPATPTPSASRPGAAAPKPAPAGEDEGRPSSVEIQVRRLGDKLATGMAGRPGQGRYERWAVVAFQELGEEVSKRRLGEVVAAMLQDTLKSDHDFLCIERLRMVEVVKEMQLAQAGLIDESKAGDVGKLAGADVLVVGSVSLVGTKYVITARVISTEKAEVQASAQVNVDAAGLVALSSDAVVLRTREDAVFRSALIPGWGQMYNRQNEKGGLLMFATLGLVAGGITFQVMGGVTEAEYRAATPDDPKSCAGAGNFGDCLVGLRQTADGRYQVARGLFIGAAAVYAYNVLDAWLFGYTPDAASKSLYKSAAVVVPTQDGVAVVGRF